MICGESCRLSPEEQCVLSTWGAKTAMVAEHAHQRNDGISQTERTWLMEHLSPPKIWHVWIAAYNGTTWRELALYQHRGRLQDSPIRGPSVEAHFIHATTFGIGRVVFLIVGTTWEHVPELFRRFDGNGLFRIWPPEPRSILWPPFNILGDLQVSALANILTQSGAFNQSLNPKADWTFTI